MDGQCAFDQNQTLTAFSAGENLTIVNFSTFSSAGRWGCAMLPRMLRASYCCLIVAIAGPTAVQAQWTIQQSHSTASLRGIHNLGGGVVWASGAGGTVLRTIDDGNTWQTCVVPPEARKLDFRAIQAFDADTAVVMSAGTGKLSRLYKTTDGCSTWKLILINPDKKGFWDALQFSSPDLGVLIGDQVHGRFPVFFSKDGGNTWQKSASIAALQKHQSIFAASNSALLIDGKTSEFYFITGGGATTVIAMGPHFSRPSYTNPDIAVGETAGGFSLASRPEGSKLFFVAVGGDFKLPDRNTGTAASLIDANWHSADTPPGGYRSAVAWYAPFKTWLAAGPNGTDISTDDGRTWQALKPAAGEMPDAGKNWNALSLPFALGAHGKIGKLSPDALRRNRK
jgi:photosystem II stability/assembly factor-like uncharacterized protein